MHKLRILFALITAWILVGPTPAPAQTTTFDLDAGYQWVDIDGNKDMYLTQVNQKSGLVLRAFSLNILDPSGKGAVDRLRIDASGFGGSPSGRFRLDAGLGRMYRLTLDYNHLETFSALPELANPLFDQGVIPGQHTWNRYRDTWNLELQLLPGRMVTPIIGYHWSRFGGPRTTTTHVGEDEFRLNSGFVQTEEEVYAGLSFAVGTFTGTLTQGWRSDQSHDQLTLAPGAGDGNNPGDVLGLPITASSITRSEDSKTTSSATHVTIAGLLGSRVHLKASYSHSEAEADTQLDSAAAGSLASFEISRFLSGLNTDVRSKAESPFTRGDLSLAYDISQHFTLDIGYQKRDMELDGWALVTSLFLDTMTFGGLSTGDITRLTEMRNHTERDQETANLRLNIVNYGPFKFWVGGSDTTQNLTLHEDAAEIVVPGSQSGSFDREIKGTSLGASLQFGKGKATLDSLMESADTAILRTDFTDRKRFRFRVQYPFGSLLEILGTAEKITSNNNDTDIGYSADTKHYAVDLSFTPTTFLTVRANWDSYKSDSKIPIRLPYDFSTEESVYTDDAKFLEGSVELNFDRVRAEAGYSSLKNDGSYEFKLNRTFARLSVDFSRRLTMGLEFEKHDYKENLLSAADFKANRYGLFFRIH